MGRRRKPVKCTPGSIWTKAHFLVGVRTNVVTAAYVTGSLAHSGAAPQLPWLLYVTDRHFDIERVLADGVYLSQKNIKAIVDLGAEARIPFRETSVYHSLRTEGGRLWNGELQFFKEHREEFDGDYNERKTWSPPTPA